MKKYSKSNHKKCGIEASKRLLKAQSKIRKWIWDFDSYIDDDDDDDENDDVDNDDEERDLTTKHNNNNSHDAKSLSFGLIGHGVPFQLFQDHVDVAWGLLNHFSSTSTNTKTTNTTTTTSSSSHDHEQQRHGNNNNNNNNEDIVECAFHSENGILKINL